jgi:hypothetical protein
VIYIIFLKLTFFYQNGDIMEKIFWWSVLKVVELGFGAGVMTEIAKPNTSWILVAFLLFFMYCFAKERRKYY